MCLSYDIHLVTFLCVFWWHDWLINRWMITDKLITKQDHYRNEGGLIHDHHRDSSTCKYTNERFYNSLSSSSTSTTFMSKLETINHEGSNISDHEPPILIDFLGINCNWSPKAWHVLIHQFRHKIMYWFICLSRIMAKFYIDLGGFWLFGFFLNKTGWPVRVHFFHLWFPPYLINTSNHHNIWCREHVY